MRSTLLRLFCKKVFFLAERRVLFFRIHRLVEPFAFPRLSGCLPWTARFHEIDLHFIVLSILLHFCVFAALMQIGSALLICVTVVLSLPTKSYALARNPLMSQT